MVNIRLQITASLIQRLNEVGVDRIDLLCEAGVLLIHVLIDLLTSLIKLIGDLAGAIVQIFLRRLLQIANGLVYLVDFALHRLCLGLL